MSVPAPGANLPISLFTLSIYRSQMSHGKNKKIFRSIRRRSLSLPLPSASLKKSFQMVRYYRRTSVPACHHNVGRGRLDLPGIQTSLARQTGQSYTRRSTLTICVKPLTQIVKGQPLDETDEAIEIIDISEYQPRRIPSKQWRDCIKQIYEADPLCYPKCGGYDDPALDTIVSRACIAQD